MSDFTDSLEKILLGSPRGIVLAPRGPRAHRLPRVGTCARRHAHPRRRPGSQGLDHPARDGARRDALDARLRPCLLLARGARGQDPRVARAAVWPRRSSTASITSGAESDIQQLTQIARQMVGRWGMSEAVGPIAVLPADGQGPLLPGVSETSEATQRLIDEEVRRLVEVSHEEVTRLLARPSRRAREPRAGAAEGRNARRARTPMRRRACRPTASAPTAPPPRRADSRCHRAGLTRAATHARLPLERLGHRRSSRRGLAVG